MPLIVTHSPQETFDLGRAWGALAQAGWVFGLHGGLGAGKTQLVKGIAEGLGITEHGAKNLMQRAKQQLRACVEQKLT